MGDHVSGWRAEKPSMNGGEGTDRTSQGERIGNPSMNGGEGAEGKGW